MGRGAGVVVRRELGRVIVGVEWCCFVEVVGLGFAQGLASQVEEEQVRELGPGL